MREKAKRANIEKRGAILREADTFDEDTVKRSDSLKINKRGEFILVALSAPGLAGIVCPRVFVTPHRRTDDLAWSASARDAVNLCSTILRVHTIFTPTRSRRVWLEVGLLGSLGHDALVCRARDSTTMR